MIENNNILDLDQLREHVRGYGGLEEVVVLRLIERIEILTAALRRVEYETGDPDTFGCPACGALEGTPHAGCCEVGNALSGVSEKTGRSKDAALNALDEIAKLCGCPHWDYPGQLVRDVTHLVAQNATLRVRAEKAEGLLEQARGMLANDEGAFRTDLEQLIYGVEPDLSGVLEVERLRAEVKELTESKDAALLALDQLVVALEKSYGMTALFGDFFEHAKRLMWPDEGEPKATNYLTVNVSQGERQFTLTLQAVDGKTPVDLLNEKDAVLQSVREGLNELMMHPPLSADFDFFSRIDRLRGIVGGESTDEAKTISMLLGQLQGLQTEVNVLTVALAQGWKNGVWYAYDDEAGYTYYETRGEAENDTTERLEACRKEAANGSWPDWAETLEAGYQIPFLLPFLCGGDETQYDYELRRKLIKACPHGNVVPDPACGCGV